MTCMVVVAIVVGLAVEWALATDKEEVVAAWRPPRAPVAAREAHGG